MYVILQPPQSLTKKPSLWNKFCLFQCDLYPHADRPWSKTCRTVSHSLNKETLYVEQVLFVGQAMCSFDLVACSSTLHCAAFEPRCLLDACTEKPSTCFFICLFVYLSTNVQLWPSCNPAMHWYSICWSKREDQKWQIHCTETEKHRWLQIRIHAQL